MTIISSPPFEYELRGAKEGLRGIYRLSRDTKNITEAMSLAGVNKLKDMLIADMQRGKSGRWYSNLPNRSSAPEESPAKQTGALIRSISTYTVSSQGSKTEGRAAIGAGRGLPRPYAWYLEYGTPGGQMAPRRMFLQSLIAWQDQIEGAMWDEWNKRKGDYGVK